MVSRVLALLGLLCASCGDGRGGGPSPLVGAACRGPADCQVRCESDSQSFPGGFCTVPCRVDPECPSSEMACIDRSGGMCAFLCGRSSDCAFLGPGYECRDKDHVQGGRVPVCIGN